MVKLLSIKQNNAAFATDISRSSGLVCVFVGATSGIGAGTLEVMVSTLHNSTFYILGRSAQKFKTQEKRLKALNSSCQLTYLECDVSLLSEVDAACMKISAEKVDIVYMSQGLVPLNGPEYTSEGIEVCFALSYYSRIRLLTNLLPLLRKSSRPRVLSVLNGGKEKAVLKEDLGLEKETNWSVMACVNHTTTCMSLALDYLANEPSNKSLTLMHAFPGLVRTEIFARLDTPKSSSIFWWIALACIRNVVGFLMTVIGTTSRECGERQVFHLTSDTFASGSVCLINESSEEVTPNAILQKYQNEKLSETVWEFTMQIFNRILD